MKNSNLDFDKQLSYGILVCAKCSKLITLEENMISVQKLPLGFQLLFASLFSPFICISYYLKVFDTGILRDSYAVPLLKTLSTLPQSIAFLCLILFLMLASNNYPVRTFVTMIYWMSAKVLLNLVAPLDSAVPSFDFKQINVLFNFWFWFC